MTVNPLRLIDRVIGVEGGFSDHPADRGGPTRWGITEQVARAYGYTGDMRQLPRPVAVEIYRKRYWQEPGLENLAEVCPDLAAELLDTGVNMGSSIPGLLLQRALNVLNRGASDYPDLAVDGRIGPMTIAALRSLLKVRGAHAEAVLTRLCDAQQAVRYIEIAEARPSQEAFTWGWIDKRTGAAA